MKTPERYFVRDNLIHANANFLESINPPAPSRASMCSDRVKRRQIWCYRCINKTDLSFFAIAFPRRAVKALTELPPRRIFKFDTFTKPNVNKTILNKEQGGGETRLKLEWRQRQTAAKEF